MRRATTGLLALTIAATLTIGPGGPAFARPPASPSGGIGREGPVAQTAKTTPMPDDLGDPQEAAQQRLRQRALNLVLTGERTVQHRHGVDVVQVGTKPAPYTRRELTRLWAGQAVRPRTIPSFVQLSRPRTDKIFVVLAEFGDGRDPSYPDQDTNPAIPGPTTFDGPRHNQIPEPDRHLDNSTLWQPDYSPAHYRQLYFGEGQGVQSLKTYYERQSSGRYSVDGEVTDWVRVRDNEAAYGRSDDDPTDANGNDAAVCSGNVCPNTWNLLRDALDQWVADQHQAGRSDADIKADVASFDQQDRYDYDGDGNFDEPDGYIDHFQIVHAGEDQADGDRQHGEDAIWSHRWRAFQNREGQAGPASNLGGGTEIGDTGVWVADYTIQPENGGLSVFAHEFGHDLGLPDHYDTSGGPDNSVDWWTLMAQSRSRASGDDGIGARPADLGAWDKLQLGWLDYARVVAGTSTSVNLGPHEYQSAKPQALAVVLPPSKVVTPLPTPPEGVRQWWSGAGDNLSRSLTRSVTLGEGPAILSFQTSYDITDCGPDPCDYAYVQVNDGTGWSTLAGTITNPDEGNTIEGDSGGWVPASFDLSAYHGRSVQLRLQYASGVASTGTGIYLDDLRLTSGGSTVFADGAEDGANGWTVDGFTVVGASLTTSYNRYYLASYRSYVSYDAYLRTGPYSFGYGRQRPAKADFFPYQPGLLVSYWDTRYVDNNTSAHPGHGLVLPIDAHPAVRHTPDGRVWRGRIQVYDAPFSLRRADSLTLHVDGLPTHLWGAAAEPLFDDTRSYFRSELPGVGVQTPGLGVRLRVTRQQGTSMSVRLGSTRPLSPAAVLADARRAARS
ncbi:immune inhibitor A domain-containing protein [uncultured Friedmanniella sp.]|uniref:immune inhibitor A domain-containing protein n=1 Tax=uncultured Friedmanniella sp. TaxID=335381 RepID=UPI0035CA996B